MTSEFEADTDSEMRGQAGFEAPLRVLVVDDDPDIRRLLSLRLKARRYDVETAASGDEALTRLDELAPDLMMLDVSMPGASGLEVLARVRADGRDIAVIMTTAFGSERMAIDALRQGADDYLRKPFEAEEFRTVVSRTASQLLLRRQNAELRRRLEEQHRALEAELARAARVQASLLPESAPTIPGYELAAVCRPARDVGGDFYDWQLRADGSLSFVLADVMGKGMPAALLMATVRSALRAVASFGTPAERVNAVEHGLAADLDRSDAFVTLLHAQLDPASGGIAFVDAGHGHGFVRRRGGGVEELPARGLPLGALPGLTYQEGSLVLEPGDSLILYSDGLPDARPDAVLDPSTIAARIGDDDRAPAIVDLLAALAESDCDRPDDLTLVVLRRNGDERG
jgi:sigma-B regulation protein RsbU (phosphoserine phosphatase)